MANLAYKFRLYPDAAQKELIGQTFGCCRKVWNLMLADKIAAYEATGRNEPYSPAMYKGEFPFLREVDSMALCNEQMHLQQAFRNFWRDKSVGFPRWKSRKRPKQSYTTSLVNGNIRLEGRALRLPKLGLVRCKAHRRIPSSFRIKSVTVSRNGAGRYFASILVEYAAPDPVAVEVGSSLGLDYSSPHFYVGSNGAVADPPHPYAAAQKRLAIEQRRLSRMQRGSANWRRQKLKIGRIHQRIADVRRDWVEKESTRIANSFDLVSLESLNMKEQARGLSFGKRVGDNAFGAFRSRLEQKMSARGKHVVYIDKWFPSSKLCRDCGCTFAGLKLGVGEWDCPECGAHHIRDAYAAETIRLEGLRIFSGLGKAGMLAGEPQGLRG